MVLFLICTNLVLIYSNLLTLTGGMLRNVCSLEIKPVFIHIGYRLKMDLLVLLYQKLLTDFISRANFLWFYSTVRLFYQTLEFELRYCKQSEIVCWYNLVDVNS